MVDHCDYFQKPIQLSNRIFFRDSTDGSQYRIISKVGIPVLRGYTQICGTAEHGDQNW